MGHSAMQNCAFLIADINGKVALPEPCLPALPFKNEFRVHFFQVTNASVHPLIFAGRSNARAGTSVLQELILYVDI